MKKTKICLAAAIVWSIVCVVCIALAVIKHTGAEADKVVVFAYSVCALSALFLAFVDFLRFGVYRKLDKDGHL